MILTDLHLHTCFCDGKNTPEEIVKEAIGRGFSAIGFSGHGYTDFDTSYCMSKEDTKKYIEDILRAKESAPFEVYLGIEKDILSDLDIRWFESCVKEEALATLLVSERKTSRYLLFDPATMLLKGWTNINTGEVRSPYPDLDPERCLKLAFSGIHILSDKVFDVLESYARSKGLYEESDTPRFPIMDFYLTLCAEYKIYGVKAEALHLVDVGKLDTIEVAEREILRLT